MTETGNDSGTPREGPASESRPRMVEDGGVERTRRPADAVQGTPSEPYRRGQSFREWTRQPDLLQLSFGVLFATSILGATAGLTGSVSPAVLTAVGTSMFFFTALLFVVVLLQQAASEPGSPSDSWAQEDRAPIERRP